MSAYYQTLHHIVFRTKRSERTIVLENSRELYAYIYGILTKKKCKTFRINGTEDHVHILTDLHSSVALADLIKDIKTYSSLWAKESGLFPHFDGWATRYCALVCSKDHHQTVYNYVLNQREHHKRCSLEEELYTLCLSEGVKFDQWFFRES